jgi:hypothetical protein
MSIVRRLFTHSRPAAQADRDLAAELARLHDLQRAGILSLTYPPVTAHGPAGTV